MGLLYNVSANTDRQKKSLKIPKG